MKYQNLTVQVATCKLYLCYLSSSSDFARDLAYELRIGEDFEKWLQSARDHGPRARVRHPLDIIQLARSVFFQTRRGNWCGCGRPQLEERSLQQLRRWWKLSRRFLSLKTLWIGSTDTVSNILSTFNMAICAEVISKIASVDVFAQVFRDGGHHLQRGKIFQKR